MECSICGISGQIRNVSDALSSTGIIRVCDRCAKEEGLISLKRPKLIEEEPGRETMYQRMSRLAGVKPKEQRMRPIETELQEKSLRTIIDKNYEEKMKRESLVLKPRQDLVDNFHWIIMRIRRVKGLTQKQLADRIEESEAAVKMAEQGVVPEGYKLLDKLERFLKVKLIRERKILPPTQKPQRGIVFDKEVLNALTIADLQRMKKEREAENNVQKAVNSEEKNEDEYREEEEDEEKESDTLRVRNYDRLDYE
jgi:ribosome-binding protein aMBF1 (putative translation factor)